MDIRSIKIFFFGLMSPNFRYLVQIVASLWDAEKVNGCHLHVWFPLEAERRCNILKLLQDCWRTHSRWRPREAGWEKRSGLRNFWCSLTNSLDGVISSLLHVISQSGYQTVLKSMLPQSECEESMLWLYVCLPKDRTAFYRIYISNVNLTVSAPAEP